MELKLLNMANEEEIKLINKDAFYAPPWNDRWNDEDVFHKYIEDIIDNKNSLSFGIYEGNELVGIALGRMKHWFDGIEYCIDDFCIKTSRQGQGFGSKLIAYIKNFAFQHGFKRISLLTDKSASAYNFYKKNQLEEATERVCFYYTTVQKDQ